MDREKRRWDKDFYSSLEAHSTSLTFNDILIVLVVIASSAYFYWCPFPSAHLVP